MGNWILLECKHGHDATQKMTYRQIIINRCNSCSGGGDNSSKEKIVHHHVHTLTGMPHTHFL